jgi:hypothetical protein
MSRASPEFSENPKNIPSGQNLSSSPYHPHLFRQRKFSSDSAQCCATEGSGLIVIEIWTPNRRPRQPEKRSKDTNTRIERTAGPMGDEER